MIRKNDTLKLKENIDFCVGQSVRVTTNKGKKSEDTQEGVLESTYPAVFTVKFENKQASTIKSAYKYNDILTNTIEVIRCSDNTNIRNLII